jgi:hypothetical protein
VPTGKSIDGALIHRVAVESDPRYTADGGITIPDAMTSSRTLNIHPHGSYLMRVERTRASVCEAIGRGPLVVGLCVNEAWTEGDESEAYIDPTQYQIQPENGHCVIVADIMWQGGQPYALIVNSWGRKWRWSGLCLMHVDALLSTMLGEECYVVDYAGTETDNGWMRHLIRVQE